MSKVKNEIVGNVLVHTPDGPRFLAAGDDVPTGAAIAPALTDGKSEETNGTARNSRRRTKATSESDDS